MRRYFKSIIIITILILFIFLVSSIIIKTENKIRISQSIKRLPSFSFYTLNNSSFSSESISSGPVLILRFHPECDHCRYEIAEVLKSRIPLKFNTILMISSANPDSLRVFFKQFRIEENPQIVTTADTTDQFHEIFGNDIIPSIYLYDENLKLIKSFYGEVKAEAILKQIEKE